MAENDISSLVLDLRNNKGGETGETVKFFDLFAPAGNQVVNKEEKSGKLWLYETTDDVKYRNLKIVVLVSEETLSSGEIIAAFFKDTGLGTVIGTQTGGKGVFQKKYFFDQFCDSGYYYVNDLPNYDGVGITPDIVIEMDNELIDTEDDIQLKKAIEFLS